MFPESTHIIDYNRTPIVPTDNVDQVFQKWMLNIEACHRRYGDKYSAGDCWNVEAFLALGELDGISSEKTAAKLIYGVQELESIFSSKTTKPPHPPSPI